VDRFGDRSIAMLHAQEIGAWRATLHGAKRYRAHRALRQVLEAAVRWKWIEENPARLVKNPAPPARELHPFESWAEVDAVAVELGDRYGPLVICLVGTGLRPEEAFGLEWRDVDLGGRTLTVRRAFAKGRLKDYTKTQGSTRRVPLRRRVVDALESIWVWLLQDECQVG
jgi:integrase